ncbi:MAG: LysR family transcriptional regulator [Devosiaceae bacterium]|nr:LysR family transcriptional regulator [Devosiaceae bacterium MH13]
MKDISWDDLRLFLLVAETGGLSGAARESGLSPPTIGRRMLALEQQTGQALFARSQTGYALTKTGDALVGKVRVMHAAAQPVHSLLDAAKETPLVRLSAGTGTALFLADRFQQLSQPGDPFRLSFVTTEAVLDIAHREVDLGIRSRPAQSGNLASRKLANIRFAPYRSWSAGEPERLEWVAMDPAIARYPAARWVHEQSHPIRVLANSVATIYQLVRSGGGIGVMPCFIGDSDPGLARAGPLIEELREEQHLVMHADDRHQPNTRRVIDRLATLYDENRDLLAGERALRG